MDVSVSFPLAFVAGLVSFLSPCVLPVVPGYITFVSGVTLEDLESGDVAGARRRAALHAVLFGIGFGIVFMTLGAAASVFGRALTTWLPTVTRVGGVIVILFGLHMLGVFRTGALDRERRFHFARKPVGWLGTVAVGIAFGAGWTPCIGPVLGSILFFAGMEATVAEATLLLGTYGLGLAIPFVGSAILLNWFLAGARRIRRHLGWIERVAGGVLVALGLMMVSGHFATLSAFLADMGQLINLES
ncbi:MAG TPA: cytochrome c biogenesis protein CcdA [Longimicrobiales bacterium]|nr:cytochrome c biogenesis protein CcdA [Longimicrobiales bacterium]